MNKTLFSIAAASVLMAGAVAASADSTTTTTTWSNEQAPMLEQYSTTKHYSSFNDPSMRPSVGMELPSSVTVYPIPETMRVPTPERYSYSIINNRPVVVERTTRKVVHTWD